MTNKEYAKPVVASVTPAGRDAISSIGKHAGAGDLPGMTQFSIYHRDKHGIEHEYEGLFRTAHDALRDCAMTFGIGKMKVKSL